MANRVPIKRPDCRIMALEVRLRLILVRQPVGQRAVHPTTHPHVTMHRVPCQRRHRGALPLERPNRFGEVPQIPELDALVTRGGEEPVAVLVPVADGDLALVVVDRPQLAAAARVQERDDVVLVTAHQQALLGVPGDCLNISALVDGVLHRVRVVVPNLHLLVVAAGRELVVKRRRRDGSDPSVVCVEADDVRHLGVPVLDGAHVVACDHVLLVVRPRHRAVGILVPLRDRFEVEVQAVPQREFARLRARDDAPPLRRPHRAVDRELLAIHRRVAVVCAVRVARVVRHAHGRQHVAHVLQVWLERDIVLLHGLEHARLQVADDGRVAVHGRPLVVRVLALRASVVAAAAGPHRAAGPQLPARRGLRLGSAATGRPLVTLRLRLRDGRVARVHSACA